MDAWKSKSSIYLEAEMVQVAKTFFRAIIIDCNQNSMVVVELIGREWREDAPALFNDSFSANFECQI